MKRRIRIVLTDTCNFNCPCCYNEGSLTKNTNKEIDFDQLVIFLKKIENLQQMVM